MRKFIIAAIVALGLMFGASKPAMAGPEVWTFTCDWYLAYPAGIITGNSGTFVQLRAYCWYEATYMGSTITAGNDWYMIMAPIVFYKKHGPVVSAETYAGNAEPL